MKIYLIRHAQAEHNLTNNVGILDPQLTSLGLQQCNNYKHKYKDVNYVISSSSSRTLQTSLNLFDSNNLYATDLLLEYQTGVNCNKRHSMDIQRKNYPMFNFDSYHVDEIKQETTWSDGESRAKRVIDMLHRIKSSDKVLAIVSHANFIRNIITLLDGYKQEELNNCDCYIIYI